MTLIPVVRGQLSSQCLTNRIRKGRCSLSLDETPPDRLIVDLDKPGGPIGMHERRCDHLFFAEPAVSEQPWAAPIELKGGTFRAAEVESQLQSGTHAIDRLVPNSATIYLVPIVAGKCHKAERRSLRRRKVTFRGAVKRIKLRPCNSRLAAAFGQ